jgi:hypothetical protein
MPQVALSTSFPPESTKGPTSQRSCPTQLQSERIHTRCFCSSVRTGNPSVHLLRTLSQCSSPLSVSSSAPFCIRRLPPRFLSREKLVVLRSKISAADRLIFFGNAYHGDRGIGIGGAGGRSEVIKRLAMRVLMGWACAAAYDGSFYSVLGCLPER